jgi:sulfur carrier protein
VHLTVNGEAVQLDAPVTVADLVAARAEDHRRVAVARNGEVVARSAWAATALEEDDAVEVLVAVAGG